MDSIWVLLIPLPCTKGGQVYDVDPEADTVIIVPPGTEPFAPWDPKSDQIQNGSKNALSQSGVRINVSSRHLTLASGIFRRKLNHFSRNTSVQPDGRIHLYTSQRFDPRAAAIVMNAVHAKGFKMPKAVDLETLAQIAFFADTFGLLEAVSVYVELWALKLQGQFPEIYNRDLILWIYISHVFRLDEPFKAATRIAAIYSDGPIRNLGLPLQHGVVAAIDVRRQELVARSLSTVYGILDSLSGGAATCDESHCDSLLLGTLIKLLSKKGILWPRPAKPFTGVSYTAIIDDMARLSQHLGGRAAKAVNGVNGTTKHHANGTNGVHVNGVNGVHKPLTKTSKGQGGEVHLSGTHPGKPAVHHCGAMRLVAGFGQLDALADEVEGVELETV
ncbi:hypothetical protein B0T14DRAFT_429010 [Immersiella caudata]|uniref:BTB domain-containing protein n=1 Tax=Immersiella caudata TaxID=314043 RepID=A0AA40C4R0_9PEZI|nr:hypothetical protein B0T14DRAFT_429010 [Immersiella caudata]